MTINHNFHQYIYLDYRWDKYRHLTTLRLSKLYQHPTSRAKLFFGYAPTDKDGYLRPSIDYDFTDNLKVSLGANLAWGEDMHTDLGQMKKNKNVYLRLRYSF